MNTIILGVYISAWKTTQYEKIIAVGAINSKMLFEKILSRQISFSSEPHVLERECGVQTLCVRALARQTKLRLL